MFEKYLFSHIFEYRLVRSLQGCSITHLLWVGTTVVLNLSAPIIDLLGQSEKLIPLFFLIILVSPLLLIPLQIVHLILQVIVKCLTLKLLSLKFATI